MLDPGEVEDLVVAELGDTALFGARFRENAARALLIPRRRPGQRTPLWQQRLKAQSLLQVARQATARFPVVLETYRECLQDVFDLPALRGLLQGLQTRELDLVEVETQSASPYSASLLFDYIATYMYEDDTPPAERRAQALSLDRDLLRELLGQEELRDLLDARRGRGGRAAAARRRRGRPTSCTTSCGCAATCAPGEYDAALAAPLLDERRAVVVRIAGEERLIAAEDAGPLPRRARRDAAVRAARRVPRGRPRLAAAARAALREGPRAVHDRRGERALRPRRRATCSLELERDELLVRGELRPGGTEREWCDPDVLRRLRRASLAALRREVEPVEQEALARFLPVVARHRPARFAARSARAAAGAAAAGRARGSARCCPRRVPGYRPEHLDALCASGEVVWIGAGPDRVALYFREDAAALGQVAGAPAPEGAEHDAIRAALVAARSSGSTCSTRPASTRRSRCRRSGISSGRAR